MKRLVKEGLAKAAQEYANREDDWAMHDLEIETEFWLRVEECEFCYDQLCTIHYERLVMCL
jgi:hypothetical protein